MARTGPKRLLAIASMVAACLAPAAAPAAVLPPLEVAAADVPNDSGNAIEVVWKAGGEAPPDLVYRIERRPASGGAWQPAGEARRDQTSFLDAPSRDGRPTLPNATPFVYRVVARASGEEAASGESAPAAAAASWFHTGRRVIFVFFVLFFSLVVALIEASRRGRPIYIRPIAGLQALEEAVGRATEMGRPVFFMPGIDEANNIQTLYGMVILQHVTRLVAAYETPLIVAVGKAFVVPLAQETVRQGYLDAGRPDLYKPQIVRYFSDEQFATVTAVTGVFVREKPATNLYFGSFYAESLILAETGFLTGAIQIAGTGNVHQLPFFVVACDYALVGEEFFAVSAYLSKDPKLLGSLKAMDFAKASLVLLLAAGSILALVHPESGAWLASTLQVN